MCIYPCRSCIIFTCCTEICPKIESKNRYAVTKSLSEEICPDCGNKVVYVRELLPAFGMTERKECNICNHIFAIMNGTYLRRYHARNIPR